MYQVIVDSVNPTKSTNDAGKEEIQKRREVMLVLNKHTNKLIS